MVSWVVSWWARALGWVGSFWRHSHEENKLNEGRTKEEIEKGGEANGCTWEGSFCRSAANLRRLGQNVRDCPIGTLLTPAPHPRVCPIFGQVPLRVARAGNYHHGPGQDFTSIQGRGPGRNQRGWSGFSGPVAHGGESLTVRELWATKHCPSC